MSLWAEGKVPHSQNDGNISKHSISQEIQMKQSIHTALNWMDYSKLKAILEEHGFAVNPDESEDDLREAVRANVEDGTISENEIDTSNNPETGSERRALGIHR